MLLKRAENTDSRFYYSGALAYDFDGKQLRKNGQEVKLTATEIRLLEAFLAHRNQVLTREQLLAMGKNREQSSGTGSHQDSFWHWIQME